MREPLAPSHCFRDKLHLHLSCICLVVLACSPYLVGCQTEAITSSDVYLFVDVTDATFQSTIYDQDLPRILAKMKVDQVHGGYSGGQVRLFLINDISESKFRNIVLEEGHPGLLGQNPLDRIDVIKVFYRELDANLKELIREANWSTNESKIYQNVCRELRSLAESARQQRVAIIYSDMLENGPRFSFYQKNQQEMATLISNAIKIRDEILSQACVLPDLANIEIHVVIPKRTRQNDEMVNAAERFWTPIFSSKGARVIWGSSLKL